ncbi:TRAP transporter small permease subunit [Chloroflexota bacterium]
MKRFVNYLDRGVYYLSQFGRWTGCLFIFITTVMITINSILRYFFSIPLMFADEYSLYLFAALVYMGLGYTLRTGKHVSADVIVSRLKPRVRSRLAIITSTIGLIVIGYMFWYARKNLVLTYKTQMTALTPLETPLWYTNVFITVGLGIFIVDMIAYIVHLIIAQVEGVEPEFKEDLTKGL